MAEELNDQERRETELWRVLDWSLWGNGLGDVLRESIADKTFAAITVEERETAERCIKAWHERRGPSMAVGEGTELAKRVAYLEARVGELNNTIGELRAESENRLQVGDRLGWRLVEAQQETERLRSENNRLRREVEFEALGTNPSRDDSVALEELETDFHDRAQRRAESGGDSPQCDGDCDNSDCHMTSAVAAWQMAAAAVRRRINELDAGPVPQCAVHPETSLDLPAVSVHPEGGTA